MRSGALAPFRQPAFRAIADSYDRRLVMLFAQTLMLAATTGSTIAAIPLLLVAGGDWVTALSTINIVVQRAAPPAVVGWCLALYQMSAFGAWWWGAYG